MHVAAAAQPAQGQLLGRRLEEVLRSEAPARAVIAGDGSAEDDAPVPAQRPEGGREVLAADVVEVHVDSVRRAARQLVGDAAPVVVEGRVQAKLAQEIAELL